MRLLSFIEMRIALARLVVATLVVLLLLTAGVAPSALADAPYPVTNPTYIPQAIWGPQATIPTGVATNFVFTTNGVSTLYIRIAGSPSGLAATVQGSEARAPSTLAWTNLGVDLVGANVAGGGRIASISAAGLYRVNVSGFAQIRVAVSALTSGATTLTMSGGPGVASLATIPLTRYSYKAASLVATGATTHFWVVAGSATKTIRITHAECSGLATTAIDLTVTAEVDSTADSVDAGTAVTAVPLDSGDSAASATVVKHTTSPTSGTLVGLIDAGALFLGNAATVIPVKWSADYGRGPGEQEVVLRGVAQEYALTASAAFGTGASVGCSVTWTEE